MASADAAPDGMDRAAPLGMLRRWIQRMSTHSVEGAPTIDEPGGAAFAVAALDEAFIAESRRESRHPLIVSGADHVMRAPEADLIGQLAVLLNDGDARIAFNWLGRVDDASRARLRAAGVGVFDGVEGAARASKLATGWVYLATGGASGFARHLAEAMAAGVPCVAFDCAAHRALIRDGQTGFLCAHERALVEAVERAESCSR